MDPTAKETSSGISSHGEDLHAQRVTETKVSEQSDHLLHQCSCSLSSFSLCDSQDTNRALEPKSEGETGSRETAGGATSNSSETASQGVADYRRCCARALSPTKLSRDSLKHLQAIALNVKDPEIVSFWKSYRKSIDRLLEYFSDPVISGFLSKLAISESNAASYLDGLEAGLAWKRIDQVEESVEPAHYKVGKTEETSLSAAEESSQVDFQIVAELKANGWYKCKWGVVEIRADKVAFLKFNSPDLLPGNFLLGMPISVARHFLNRDLELLDKYGGKHPNWCEEITMKKDNAWDRLCSVLKECPIRHSQWTFCNVFSWTGTSELEVPKAHGVFCLWGNVKAIFKSSKEFNLDASMHLEPISKFIVTQVYLKRPDAKLALIYIYAAIYRGLVESSHFVTEVNKKQHEICVEFPLYHFSEDQCLDETIEFVRIKFIKEWLDSEVSVDCDVDIHLSSDSGTDLGIHPKSVWTKIPYPKPRYIEVVQTLIDEIDHGEINRDALFVRLTS